MKDLQGIWQIDRTRNVTQFLQGEIMASRKLSTKWDDMEKHEKEFFGSREDRPEDRTVTSRAKVRTELTDQIEAFLAKGGAINHIDPNVMADPPRKPQSNYGSRPI